MNSGCRWKYEYVLTSEPNVLYQTNERDHEKLQRIKVATLCQSAPRTFYDDAMCETYILRMLAPRALTPYRLSVMAAHRADFFDIFCCFLRIESAWTSSLAFWNCYHVFSAHANLAVPWLVLLRVPFTYISDSWYAKMSAMASILHGFGITLVKRTNTSEDKRTPKCLLFCCC